MEKFNDSLKLYVKKDKSKEIIKSYEAFGWSLVSEEENFRYEDLVDLEFSRPHNIPNKDELQLSQVYLEDRLEQSGKLQKNKHAKSTSFGLIVVPFAITLLVLSILWLIHFQTVRSIVLGSLMAIVGITFVILSIIVVPRLYKKEKADYEKRTAKLKKEIIDLCTYAKELIGGKYEKD